VYNPGEVFPLATLDDQLLTNNVESTQARAFNASELVACPACSRANPPTRANCLYCDAVLGVSVEATTSTATGTVPEIEAGSFVHVLAVPARSDGREVSAEIAQLLDLASSELNSLLSGRVAPLYATTETKRAQAISDTLRTVGIEPVTISDEQLNLATPPKQIAALAIENDDLTASVRRTGERVSVPWNDVVLIVLGRLYFTTTEVEHQRDKSKQVLDERQLTSDEAVLDIYSRADETGWRIRAGSFDFSCLGPEKKATAFENFRALADLLRRNSPQAVCDDGYVRLRVALNKVWPLEARAGATERLRTLTRAIDATATVSDNELQFTRYSRLLRFFHDSELQDDARQS
jgi:hypothetical protein